MTNVTGLLPACLLWYSINIIVFGSFTIRSFKRKVKFGGNCFQTELLSRLSRKVCRLLPSAALCVSSLIWLPWLSPLFAAPVRFLRQFSRSLHISRDQWNARKATTTRKLTIQYVWSAKQQFGTCITLFSTFLCRYCTTTTWKCLTSLFMENVNKRRRRNFLSLSELGHGS